MHMESFDDSENSCAHTMFKVLWIHKYFFKGKKLFTTLCLPLWMLQMECTLKGNHLLLWRRLADIRNENDRGSSPKSIPVCYKIKIWRSGQHSKIVSSNV